jgi:light-harvesting complex II chlorophyll a/b binding protein 6
LLSASFGARVGGAAGPKKLIVMAAAQAKKSWVPGVRGGGNLIDPEWLDGS